MFAIEDEAHDELHGNYESFDAAVAELKRRAAIAWNIEPNLAPCSSWKTCGRRYEIIEYSETNALVRRVAALDVSASGILWHL